MKHSNFTGRYRNTFTKRPPPEQAPLPAAPAEKEEPAPAPPPQKSPTQSL
ncbi:MAG: hypothetical protein IIV90_01250 [Oscillospiraceae bacterium]|nr:hypothetical protein [Oscillospiraceae bacterium]